MCSVQGWHTAVKPIFEVVSLERKAVGASVPLPKTIIRYILSAVLPRVLQRKLLGLLPRELGQYLLDVGQGGRLAGDHPLYPLLHPLHISRQQPFCACTTNPLTLCSPPTTRPLSDPLRCDSALLVACVTHMVQKARCIGTSNHFHLQPEHATLSFFSVPFGTTTWSCAA